MAKVSAVILIYDIRGFTAASKKIATGDLGAFATAAHRSILELFAERPPSFVKNLGDGHLLIWETTDDPEKELVGYVIAAAEKARAAFPAFVAGQKSTGVHLPKHVGIGVAVGDVSRTDDYYGVAVNLAARLQNLARPEGLAMDSTVFGMAGKRDELIRQGFRKTKVSLKGLGSTLVWVNRPFSWERLLGTIGKYAALAMIPLFYILLADWNANVPGGEPIRRTFDRYDASIFRRVRTEAEIRAAADADRRAIAVAMLEARLPDGRVGTNLRDKEDPNTDPASVWGSSQAVTGLLATPHLSLEEKRGLITVYGEYLFKPENFIEGYGWLLSPDPLVKYTLGEPALWTVSAFARALSIPGLLEGDARALAEKRLRQAQEAAMRYHPRAESGGWNIFPNQQNLDLHSPYTSALALLALLETHRASQPWEGSMKRRDELLEQTGKFLISLYTGAPSPRGWRRTASPAAPISEGLTLQIYAELLRAQEQAGLVLPAEMLAEIPAHLERLKDRTMESADDAGEYSAPFTNHLNQQVPGNESINFLWHSWAVETCVRWLASPAAKTAAHEEVVRVRRTLGILIVDLSAEMRKKAIEGMSYIGGETLLGYSVVPPPK